MEPTDPRSQLSFIHTQTSVIYSHLAFHPAGVGKLSTSLHRPGLTRGVLAYVRLQVKLCDTTLR